MPVVHEEIQPHSDFQLTERVAIVSFLFWFIYKLRVLGEEHKIGIMSIEE